MLQITVDQLRGDLSTRYFDGLGEGGLRYLWEEGTVFADAHHSHANTETIIGHTTLAIGAYPAAHGMIGNTWLDRQTGEVAYGIEDARYRLLTVGADVDRQAEIDLTQRVARSEGRSPAAIMVSTFSDELASHTAGRAKVFGISVKDRGAVSMAASCLATSPASTHFPLCITEIASLHRAIHPRTGQNVSCATSVSTQNVHHGR